ncbi:hypothetical protein D9613_006378 [Agrocybe pediades]|uniref:Transposase n=1 Tax=Agrocybe pediades TaxID=84607 RepID=A0A8H4QV41_9AGAR|nr:hypothetical protein D9613_011290 [Agrocybe pediades]KAF4617403.1 hypothetical protein D9613_006378 [Agrocybe pediades]
MRRTTAQSTLSKPTASTKVVCTCTSCKSKTFTNQFGQVQPGSLVAPTTRKRHRDKDLADCYVEPNLTPENTSTVAAPALAAEDQIKEQNGAEKGAAEEIQGSTGYSRPLFRLICTLVAWLHLVCGLSRASSGRVLQFLQVIVDVAMQLGRVGEYLGGEEGSNRSWAASPPHSFTVPKDVRTSMSVLSIEPNIIRSVCCPKCFHSYSLEELPEICMYRETQRSRRCSEPLWTTRTTRGGAKRVPRRLYNTQDFENWLEYFLSRPGIEDTIDKSYARRPQPNSDVMENIWDSPAWRSLGTFTTTQHNLTFSYYIDWFNPFTNKIAGKSVSCGAIIMFCLNLPHDLQHRPENVFIAGITPPPYEPSVTSITAVSDPIVDRLEAMWNGKVIRTYRHPEGIMKRAAILAAIGDLLAIKKALGYAGTASHNFCSFCTLRRADIDNLDYENYRLRVGVEVLSAAVDWKTASTKTRREQIFKKHGVRWSSLHRLVYRDPVRHTVLGMMHNWLEGVLQHHARILWGIGGSDKAVQTESADDCEAMDVDIDMLDEELEALQAESQLHGNESSHLLGEKRIAVPSRGAIDSISALAQDVFLDDDDGSDDSEYNPPPDSGSDDDEGSILPGEPVFTTTQLSEIRRCLANAVIPSWMERPPTNLGEKSHGKLKADHWLVLFSVFLPLVLPKLWLATAQSRDLLLLENFHDLVICTNIIIAYTATPTSADLYLSHYVNYRKSTKKLFPAIPTRPNHHYAMHVPDQIKFWGPLIYVSEFKYETKNGNLQKINTNGHMWELDFTMLRQICRRGRLMAQVNDSQSPSSAGSLLSRGLSILRTSPVELDSDTSPQVYSALDEAKINAAGNRVPEHVYNLLLCHARMSIPLPHNSIFRHYADIPHPIESFIFPPYAVPLHHLNHKGRAYSTYEKHRGNSSISFRAADGNVDIGFINSIWRQIVNGKEHTFLVISTHSMLSPEDARLNPYTSRPGFMCNICYADKPVWGDSDPSQIAHSGYEERL